MIVAIDIETKDLKIDTQINFVGIYCINSAGKELFRMFKFPEEAESCRDFLEAIKKKGAEFVAHNGKFDSARLYYSYGIDIHISHDTMILGYLMSTVDELKNNKKKWLGLKYMAPRILGVDNWDIDIKKKTSEYDQDVEHYLMLDCKYCYQLYDYFSKHLPKEKLATYGLMMNAVNAYRDIECNGLPIDRDLLLKTLEETRVSLEAVDKILTEFNDINYNSSNQLANLLYIELQLPIKAYTDKGNPSTSEDTLKDLEDEHPIIPVLLKKRKLEKAMAFLESWKEEMIQHKDGYWYLHSNFNMHGTVTGRTSSSDVNLQQIPRNKALKSLFRSCDPDWELVCLDYSQLELRFAGIVANVKAIKDSYKNNEDLHYKMASIVSGKPIDQITKEERTQAKAANFGFLYGMQAASFVDYAKSSYGVTVTPEQAAEIRFHFFELYPELLDYYTEVQGTMLTEHRVVSIMRREYELTPTEINSNSLRAAINFPVQSAGSDYVISGLIEVMTEPSLKGKVRVGATVHDSIICMVKKDENFISTIKQIKSIMESPKIAKNY